MKENATSETGLIGSQDTPSARRTRTVGMTGRSDSTTKKTEPSASEVGKVEGSACSVFK